MLTIHLWTSFYRMITLARSQLILTFTIIFDRGLPTCSNYSQMWEILEHTVTEQQTMPWCAGLPPPEHIAAPRQMDDVVPCSMTTMSYHPGIQENRHHLKQKAAICLLNIMTPVLRIYLKHIVVSINYCLGPFMVYSCEKCKNVLLFQK